MNHHQPWVLLEVRMDVVLISRDHCVDLDYYDRDHMNHLNVHYHIVPWGLFDYWSWIDCELICRVHLRDYLNNGYWYWYQNIDEDCQISPLTSEKRVMKGGMVRLCDERIVSVLIDGVFV